MESEGALRRELAAAGFGEIVVVDRAADGFMPDHARPFEARALILAGEITIRAGGRTVSYGAGDAFRLPAGLVHRESHGPAGVRYLVGRKWGPAKEKRGPGAALFPESLRFSRDRP